MTKYSIIKSSGFNRELNRYQVKCFNSEQLMHSFLNKQQDNKWNETSYAFRKSGYYFSQYCSKDGQRFLSTRELTC